MSHSNARLTVHGRRLIVERHTCGWPQAHIAAAMGVSRTCVNKWIDRFAQEGDLGLHTRSSRPQNSPTTTSAEVEQKVLRARAEHREGPDVLGPRVGVPPRTVSRILRRHGVPRLNQCEAITGDVIRASKTSAMRYERRHPGELVHMDVKKLGKIPDGGGWRAHGRANASRNRKITVGYDFVHSMVDDCSRLAYSEVLPDEKGQTCAGFLRRAIAYFAARGVPRIERLMTDKVWAYRYSLRGVCAEHGIAQKFIKPHCPWHNGKVDRLNRTLATEWAYHQVFTCNSDRVAAWLEYYNTGRPHSALGGRPPVSRPSPT